MDLVAFPGLAQHSVMRGHNFADDLRRRIMAEEYRSGEPLPRQSDLAQAYETKRAVIAEAVRVLESEGMVRAVRKRGTVVQWPSVRRRIERGTKITRDPGYTVAGITVPGAPSYNFPAAQAESWQAHGTLRASAEPCPARVAELLRVPEGAQVIRRRWVTSPAGEPPFQLVDSWIHPDGVADAPRAAQPDTGPGGYLDRLEEAGHGPIFWTEHVRARMPLPDEADLLEIAIRAIVVELARIGTSAKTRAPVEVTICLIPADRVEIITPLERDRSARWPHPRQES
jgi:DNA-binding GntR family transcriptional regulator